MSEQQERGRPVTRPVPVAVATALWIILGVITGLGAVGYYLMPYGGSDISPVSILFVVGIGVAFIVLATFVLRGSNGARIAVTVLGGVMLLGVWTIVFVVPAIVLQFLPSSNVWFQAGHRRP